MSYNGGNLGSQINITKFVKNNSVTIHVQATFVGFGLWCFKLQQYFSYIVAVSFIGGNFRLSPCLDRSVKNLS